MTQSLDEFLEGSEQHQQDDRNHLLRIEAKSATGDVIIDSTGYVVEAAPVFKYMKHWSVEEVKMYCKQRGFNIS